MLLEKVVYLIQNLYRKSISDSTDWILVVEIKSKSIDKIYLTTYLLTFVSTTSIIHLTITIACLSGIQPALHKDSFIAAQKFNKQKSGAESRQIKNCIC